MEMKVEGVLVAGGLIVLAGGDAVCVVGDLHGARHFLGDIENVVAELLWEGVEALVVGIRHNDDVAGVVAPEKGVNDGADVFVTIDEIRFGDHGVGAAGVGEAGADRAFVAGGGVAFELLHGFDYSPVKAKLGWILLLTKFHSMP